MPRVSLWAAMVAAFASQLSQDDGPGTQNTRVDNMVSGKGFIDLSLLGLYP